MSTNMTDTAAATAINAAEIARQAAEAVEGAAT